RGRGGTRFAALRLSAQPEVPGVVLQRGEPVRGSGLAAMECDARYPLGKAGADARGSGTRAVPVRKLPAYGGVRAGRHPALLHGAGGPLLSRGAAVHVLAMRGRSAAH